MKKKGKKERRYKEIAQKKKIERNHIWLSKSKLEKVKKKNDEKKYERKNARKKRRKGKRNI